MIKGTGYAMRFEDFGRINVPMALREKLNIKGHQAMEFLIDEENELIIMKKFDDSKVVEMD